MSIIRDRMADLTARMNQSSTTDSSAKRNFRRQRSSSQNRNSTRNSTSIHGVGASEVETPDQSVQYWANNHTENESSSNDDDAKDDDEDIDQDQLLLFDENGQQIVQQQQHEQHERRQRQNRSRLMSESIWLQLEKFLNSSSQLHREIHLLESYVEDVKLKHSQLLVSPHEDKKTKDELDSVMEAFNQLSRKVRKTIKEMEREFEKIRLQRTTALNNANTMERGGQNGISIVSDKSRADDRIRENQLAALNRSLLTVLRAYNEEQVRYRDFCTKRIKSYIDLTGEPIGEDELDEIIESGNLYKRMGGIFVEERSARRMMEDIEARHADIVRLEASVRELHHMFQDMAVLVEEQGEKIDTIEFNVQLAVDYTAKAKKQIKSAVAHRDRYRKKKFILYTICGVIIVIILITVVSSVCSRVGCTRSATANSDAVSAVLITTGSSAMSDDS